MNITAFLQHGAGTQGPFRTESVPAKHEPMTHHLLGLQETASGYGAKLATPYMVQVDNGLTVRWYRVYSTCYSNVSREFIVVRGERIKVGIYQ